MPQHKKDLHEIKLPLKKLFLIKLAEIGYALSKLSGIIGRIFQVLDMELQFEYLIVRLRYEEHDINYFLKDKIAENLLISFIVPTYEIELIYVKDLLKSLKAQSYSNWELCVCDDGSSNRKVYDYLLRLQKREPQRYRVTKNEKNLGISQATEKAFTLAKGDVIAFMDADDLLHYRTVEILTHVFSSAPDIDFAYTDYDFLSDVGFRCNPVRKPDLSPELLINTNYINHLTSFRRSSLDRFDTLFNVSTSGAQDWDLCLQSINNLNRVSHIPLILYHWRKRPGSVAENPNAKPWVQIGGLNARQIYISQQDSRLSISHNNVVSFKDNLPKEKYPDLYILMYGNDIKNSQKMEFKGYYYQGYQKIIFLKNKSQLNISLIINELKENNIDNEAVIIFLDKGLPLPVGEIDKLIAYAVQPLVGCVLPFRKDEMRLGYTIRKKHMQLEQIKDPRNVFSKYTGNILTGPLHCMVVEYKKLKLLISKLINQQFKNDAEFGASIGIEMLKRKYRNTSCGQMVCDVDIPPVKLSHQQYIEYDPFL